MHKAFIAKIDRVEDIPGADRIHLAYVLGERVVVAKHWGVGHVGLFFPPDLQLSEQFCHVNNLNRDGQLNLNPDVKGFFESSRRVRVQPFLKVRSEGFFCELSAVAYTGVDLDSLKLGEQFDTLNGVQVCQKYISPATRAAGKGSQSKARKADLTPHFAKHMDTEQFKYNAHRIPVGALLSFHAKVHGTSARMAYTKCLQVLPKWKQMVNKVLPVFPEWKWDYVVGTRNVVLDSPDKVGHHGKEQYRYDVLEMLKPHLEKGMTVYGEIAGYANGTPIMGAHSTDGLKDKAFAAKYGKTIVYSYGCKQTEFRFHLYRITVTNEDGAVTEFSAKQVEQWAADRGLLATTEVSPQLVYNGATEALCTFVEALTERQDKLTEDWIDPSHIAEGIIVRVDTGTRQPMFLKSKSYAFRVLEGIESEKTVDLEAVNV
jgi:hypothetical protein